MATLTVSSRSLTVSADDKNTQNEPILDNEMELEAEENHPSDEHSSTTHVYKRRWIIILLYCLYAMTNSYQWIHLNIIGNIVIKYYRESLPDDKFQRETTLDWLSMIYMIVYIPLVFPGTFLLKKKGVRVCLVAGAFLNALGAWLKVACVSPDRFPVLMFAQTVCAVAQIFTLGLPAKIAAVWFGPNEVSTATSIGIFGFQIGVAIGFLVPPIVVPNSESLDDIGSHLNIMFYAGAGFMTFLFILVVIIFKERPPKPPSRAQMLATQRVQEEHYGKTLRNLFKNVGFDLLVVTFGVNTGCYYAISTLLNPIVLETFPGHEKTAGQIGLTIVLAGVAGSVVAGIWLDRTRTYKFFMTGYLPVCFEFGAEITYPESEGISSALLNESAELFGIIFTIGCRAMMNKVGTFGLNLLISGALFLGSICTGFIKADYRRQNAEKKILRQLDDAIEINVTNTVSEKTRMTETTD
ncbi:feline leukemia virus subgroup C receptor-related protein 2-like isoform X2 [Crassostrea angulata]|uniref:feline leukemia virus subgroup C receptor-related protein 2-like isoform X2 n=1 Tax=Magallana angulata TaxID=2784310 RepID=UPI0022B1C982|nr:feline leukemia virus subgroup C receptor-related protein 2-like isoform X2 [Crassostrea angulata]